MEFASEVKAVISGVLAPYKELNADVITNACGRTLVRKRYEKGCKAEPGYFKTWNSRGRIIDHIFCGWERVFLEIARQFCRGLACTMHDAFIVPDEIDVGQLEQLIFDRTGFRIKYKYSLCEDTQ